jgi:hypothetical protein
MGTQQNRALRAMSGAARLDCIPTSPWEREDAHCVEPLDCVQESFVEQ